MMELVHSNNSFSEIVLFVLVKHGMERERKYQKNDCGPGRDAMK